MPKRSSKTSSDLNQLAAFIVAKATDEAPDVETVKPVEPEKNPAAVAVKEAPGGDRQEGGGEMARRNAIAAP